MATHKEMIKMISSMEDGIKGIDDKALYQAQVLIHNQQVIGGIFPGD